MMPMYLLHLIRVGIPPCTKPNSYLEQKQRLWKPESLRQQKTNREMEKVERTQLALLERIRQLEVEIISRGLLPIGYVQEMEEDMQAKINPPNQ